MASIASHCGSPCMIAARPPPAARGEAENADALRVDAPVGGLASHDMDRSLGIYRAPHRFFSSRKRHAILEDDAGHAVLARNSPHSVPS